MSMNEELLTFLKDSPTSFHAVANMATQLDAAGAVRLLEHERWHLEAGKTYYVMRNHSALIAFKLPEKGMDAFQIVASHSDSPSFKLKENPAMVAEEHYTRLNVEGYGGMLCAPWFDRPPSVAGRVMVRVADGDGMFRTVVQRLVALDRDLLIIPSLAIHMNRQANSGYAYNIQKDLLPLLGDASAKGTLDALIADALGIAPEAILSKELYVYNRQPGCVLGAKGEYIASPRIDDLQCAFASLKAFLAVNDPQNVAVHCVFDNEEVGSGTRQGAVSTFLKDTLTRIVTCMGGDHEDYLCCLAKSFTVSADNAHAVHPAHPDKADVGHRPYLNGGVVIKHSANQKYTTDAVSEAVFKAICEGAGVPVQHFVNRSDMAGGSTLGNVAMAQTPMVTVDVGCAQLAMHSPYETAGAADTAYLCQALTAFYAQAVVLPD